MPDQSYERSRINISYQSKVKGGENVTLPLKILVMGDFNPNPEDPEQPLKERRAWDVHKGNFNQMMGEMGTNLDFNVPDRLHEGGGDAMLGVKLRLRGRDDFRPDAIIDQVDYLRELRTLRDELKRLAAEGTKKPQLLKKLAKVLKDESRAKQLLEELGGEASAPSGD